MNRDSVRQRSASHLPLDAAFVLGASPNDLARYPVYTWCAHEIVTECGERFVNVTRCSRAPRSTRGRDRDKFIYFFLFAS